MSSQEAALNLSASSSNGGQKSATSEMFNSSTSAAASAAMESSLQYRKSHSIDAILGLRAAAAAVAVR